MTGHSVLQLAVPPLEAWVRARTAHYDLAFVSEDPRFAHAHITALGPFTPSPTPSDLDMVTRIAATTAPIRTRLADLSQFPNGIIHLVPDPADPLRDLTARLVAAFGAWPPYGGAFGTEVRPHLTLDAASDSVDLPSTLRLLEGVIPVVVDLDRLQLAWWEAGRCHVMHEWRLSGSP